MPEQLIDSFGRVHNNLRISVTDRCNIRCFYCMPAEDVVFMQRSELLSFEELERVVRVATTLGVNKIRLTGGEPLVRRNVMSLVRRLGALEGLRELALTTNGSHLARYAPALREAGVNSINISLDSLHPLKFRRLTRYGNLADVVAGIDAACAGGFDRLRLNAVILRGRNETEVPDLVAFARDRGIDIAFIEEMPLGHIVEHDRRLTLCSSAELLEMLSARFALRPLGDPGGAQGPARYFSLADSPTRVGFISPHSNNFCHLCNRVRVTAEGRLLLCLGNEHSIDLRAVMRAPGYNRNDLLDALQQSMAIKPERHHFHDPDAPAIVRFMNATGG